MTTDWQRLMNSLFVMCSKYCLVNCSSLNLEATVCAYVWFRNTLGLVLPFMFEYFYFLLKKYWENSDTFYFTWVTYFSKYLYFYLSRKIPSYLYFYLSTELHYFLQHWIYLHDCTKWPALQCYEVISYFTAAWSLELCFLCSVQTDS